MDQKDLNEFRLRMALLEGKVEGIVSGLITIADNLSETREADLPYYERLMGRSFLLVKETLQSTLTDIQKERDGFRRNTKTPRQHDHGAPAVPEGVHLPDEHGGVLP